jgi:hypothetical protein
MASKRKKQALKKVTINELQSFIEGATAFNPEDWHPDKEQWERIVEMIMNIKYEAPVQAPANVPNQQSRSAPPQAVPKGFATESSFDSDLGEPVQYDTDPVASRAPKTDMRKVKVESTGVSGVDENGFKQSGIKVKTPNVDSSKGDYDTPFQ